MPTDSRFDDRIEVQEESTKPQFYQLWHDFIDGWLPILKPSEFVVFIGIARHLKPYGKKCFPSIRSIAALCGLHVDTVSEAIASLESHGVIKVERKVGSYNVYTVYSSKQPENSEQFTTSTNREIPNTHPGNSERSEPNHPGNSEQKKRREIQEEKKDAKTPPLEEKQPTLEEKIHPEMEIIAYMKRCLPLHGASWPKKWNGGNDQRERTESWIEDQEKAVGVIEYREAFASYLAEEGKRFHPIGFARFMKEYATANRSNGNGRSYKSNGNGNGNGHNQITKTDEYGEYRVAIYEDQAMWKWAIEKIEMCEKTGKPFTRDQTCDIGRIRQVWKERGFDDKGRRVA